MAFASFMSSAAGRVARIVAGLIIIAVGVYLSLTGSITAGVIIAIVAGSLARAFFAHVKWDSLSSPEREERKKSRST